MSAVVSGWDRWRSRVGTGGGVGSGLPAMTRRGPSVCGLLVAVFVVASRRRTVFRAFAALITPALLAAGIAAVVHRVHDVKLVKPLPLVAAGALWRSALELSRRPLRRLLRVGPFRKAAGFRGGEAGGRAKSGISDDLSVSLAKNGRWCGSALSLKSETIRSCGGGASRTGRYAEWATSGCRRLAVAGCSACVPGTPPLQRERRMQPS